jgi:predicted O-linked N-acetylglucosamine transferase (SPINDLY family)
MMMNLALPEWVAHNEEEYIDKACQFAGDAQALKELRLGLRERMLKSPLMDGLGFARGVEAAYRAMFDHWRKEDTSASATSEGPFSLEPGGAS